MLTNDRFVEVGLSTHSRHSALDCVEHPGDICKGGPASTSVIDKLKEVSAKEINLRSIDKEFNTKRTKACLTLSLFSESSCVGSCVHCSLSGCKLV